MYPPVARNDRECTADWEDESGQFGGIAFRRGTKIRFPLYVLHHNPQYWLEPDIFRPERFLPENVGNIVPYSWLPFGAGPRVCIGERYYLISSSNQKIKCLSHSVPAVPCLRFAMVEVKIAMVKLLRRFILETDETTRLELLNGDMFMYSFSGINLRLLRRDTD